MKLPPLVVASLCLTLAGLSRAGQLETLQSMAGEPALIDPAYTGARPGTGLSSSVDASGLGRGVGPLVVSPKAGDAGRLESASSGIGALKRRAAGPRGEGGGKFLKGIKSLLACTAAIGFIGALIGVFVGIFGPATIVAATLAGAKTGAIVGAVLGTFAMLMEWAD